MLDESAEALEAAETRAPGSLQALAEAYRTYALTHPHLYCLAAERPCPARPFPPDPRTVQRCRCCAPAPATSTSPGPPGPSPTAW
ncbi:TetR-like C-terminal domain-containing protein [Streptomyces sp. NPDC003753]|uniref:TetR-like C-terminal domain-containing protein n=1 Tax=Streptomyces sp. NPDC058960 TaxID=3346679 RepID=UPI00368938C7